MENVGKQLLAHYKEEFSPGQSKPGCQGERSCPSPEVCNFEQGSCAELGLHKLTSEVLSASRLACPRHTPVQHSSVAPCGTRGHDLVPATTSNSLCDLGSACSSRSSHHNASSPGSILRPRKSPQVLHSLLCLGRESFACDTHLPLSFTWLTPFPPSRPSSWKPPSLCPKNGFRISSGRHLSLPFHNTSHPSLEGTQTLGATSRQGNV